MTALLLEVFGKLVEALLAAGIERAELEMHMSAAEKRMIDAAIDRRLEKERDG